MANSERSPSRDSLSRRLFLRRALLTGASAAAVLPGLGLIAACSQPASPAPAAAPTAAPTQANPFAAKPTAAAAAPTSAPAAAAPTTAPASASGAPTKMTYWGGLIFSDAANNLFSQTVKDWGKQNNLDIDV